MKRFRFLVLMTLMALSLVLNPHHSWAQDPCADGTVAAAYQQAAAAAGQQKAIGISNFWSTLPKTDVGQSYCGQALISAYNSFVNGAQGLTDPLSVIGGLLGTALGNFVNQTCSAVMSSVLGGATSLSALARICIPLPQFPALGLGSLNFTACSGGTQIPLINGSGTWQSAPPYGNIWYVQ